MSLSPPFAIRRRPLDCGSYVAPANKRQRTHALATIVSPKSPSTEDRDDAGVLVFVFPAPPSERQQELFVRFLNEKMKALGLSREESSIVSFHDEDLKMKSRMLAANLVNHLNEIEFEGTTISLSRHSSFRGDQSSAQSLTYQEFMKPIDVHGDKTVILEQDPVIHTGPELVKFINQSMKKHRLASGDSDAVVRFQQLG